VSPPDPRLDDVVELLQGVATILMEIDVKLDQIVRMLEDE
jgi:hypothetical protein